MLRCTLGFWWMYSEVWQWKLKWFLQGQGEVKMLTTPFTSPCLCHRGASGASGTGFFYSHSVPLTLSHCDDSISKHSQHFYKLEMLKSHHRLTAWRNLAGGRAGGCGESSFLASSLEKLSWVCKQPASPTTIQSGLWNHCYKCPQLKSHAVF